MVLELSNIIFTDQDDSIPSSGVEQILNTGIANTLAGNDIIIGKGDNYGFENVGTFNAGDGNDVITGYGNSNGIVNVGTFNTDDGNDTITGSALTTGIFTDYGSTFNTGKGNDIITGTSIEGRVGINNGGTINTVEGEDSLISRGTFINTGEVFLGDGNDSIISSSVSISVENSGFIGTGNGNDIIDISGFGNTANEGIIDTGNGEDSIILKGSFFNNRGGVFLGDGNDSITAKKNSPGSGPGSRLQNFNFIGTGDGNDIITSGDFIYNEGVIDTGNGDDSIIVDGGINDTGYGYSIHNNGGVINTGNGNDSIIANKDFESAPNSSGAWFLGEGDDYIKGYGSGDFYGGNGNDTLELTPGTYTVGIWGEAGESPIFTKGDQLMITSEFEKLKAGSTIYDFTSLTAGQIIVVT
jgi:hypothetical protein